MKKARMRPGLSSIRAAAPDQTGAKPLVAFLSRFSAFFSFMDFAGFFFVSFFWFMPFMGFSSARLTVAGGTSRPAQYAPSDADSAGEGGVA